MIVRTIDEVAGSERDGLGFSFHDTTVAAGSELTLQYKHHLEACYLLAGEAELTDLATGERHALGPGSMYALDEHDRHTLRVRSDLHLVCVFNPALTGAETHDADGSFPPSD